MKITFPYMGTSHITFKMLINDLGHEAMVPPRPSKRTLTLGTQYSPEFACLPFKILLGSYLEAIEQGANTVITSGGCGPCRAGWYGYLHQKILRDLGYDTKVIVMESPYRQPWDFFKKINSLLSPNGVSWWKFGQVFKKAWEKLKVLDEAERLSHRVRPFEINKGETTRVFNNCLQIIDAAQQPKEIMAAREEVGRMFGAVPCDEQRRPLKVGIIGEIYVLLEPYANLDIEATLGEMGVLTHRSIYLTDWTRENTSFEGEQDANRAAAPYLTEDVGGHGLQSVGNTVLYAKNGFAGVVQLAPFTCIPEIVAKSILGRVIKDYDIPVLTVFLDEQTGKAGLHTRLEAFVDLLMQKRTRTEVAV
jgi:predicted nucleotide-binding protein (sugar kinase/HSP70/actin superfamily)